MSVEMKGRKRNDLQRDDDNDQTKEGINELVTL